MPPVTGILETALYVEDVARSRQFYERLFGFSILVAHDRLCAMSVADRQVLLLFKNGASTQPLQLPGGVIPPHDGEGQLHFAFSIAAADLPAWEAWLEAKGVPVESRVTWERGGQSLYLRDPDGNAVELATPGVWAIY